jgi:hypothetical protein
MSIRNLRLLFAFAAAITGSAFAQTTTTHTTDFTFPLVGLGSTETLGVNLINMAAKSQGGTAASCGGSVTFINAAGTTIGTPTTFTLATDAVTSVTLPFSSAGISGIRGLVRTVVATTTTNGVPCSLASTLNTFDTATGVTHVFLVGSAPVAAQPFTIPGH